jgi:hypothetical protein
LDIAGASFQTLPYALNKFLDDCHQGVNQLPDFQSSWVWDEDRIKILLESIFKVSSVNALKSLNRGGIANFKLSPIEGALNEAKQVVPQSVLLDGQQSMKSLYQDALRGKVVETFTLKKMRFKRWFYIDVQKTLYPTIDTKKHSRGCQRIAAFVLILDAKSCLICRHPSSIINRSCTPHPK